MKLLLLLGRLPLVGRFFRGIYLRRYVAPEMLKTYGDGLFPPITTCGNCGSPDHGAFLCPKPWPKRKGP